MEAAEDIKTQFSKNLFWDININDLDMEQHAYYVVGRVLDYGKWDDWVLMKKYYGLDKIKKTALNIRSMFPKSLAFIATITHTPEIQFRCYTFLQSPNRPWYF